MNIINIEHVSKLYGEKQVFDDVSFGISEGDKIGIIGINGTGKSTLLRMIAGTEEPDEGQIIRQNNLKLSMLTQSPVFPEGVTVLDYVAGTGEERWERETEAKKILNTLDLTDHEALCSLLSGGQRKRAALARVLVQPSDVLILDEPTNHIDHQMAAWLEDYLKAYRGTLIMVTHDRYFLDQVTNGILEIDHGRLYYYQANYSRFLELKAEREEMALATERKRQSIMRMEIEWAKRGCRARTTKQKARLERLEQLKAGKAPVTDAQVQLDAVHTRMGKKTIELSHVSKGYGDRTLIRDFTYILLKNQRLGIIGPNGCGKSTLMKLLIGSEQPDEGSVTIGETVRIGYFAQECEIMNPRQRVIDYIRDVADYIPTRDGSISASQMLERFLFDGAMQYSQIGKLSGGEMRRLYLLKVLAGAPNVLILDEPTNDLDIPTLTILEDYLDSFEGIIIAVSHDRYFLDSLADRIFAFEAGGHLQQYEGGYTDYLEAARLRHPELFGDRGGSTPDREAAGRTISDKTKAAAASASAAAPGTAGVSGQTGRKKPQGTVRLKFTYKEQKEYETIDDDIAALEARIEDLEAEIAANATDFVKLRQLMAEKEQTEADLEAKMDRWVYLNDLAERIAQQ